MEVLKTRPLRCWARLLTTSNLSPSLTSTTFRGTAFEERTRRILQNHLSMSLRRVGGKADGGVDLLGWWWLPPSHDLDHTLPRRRLRVLVQCKAEKKKASPRYVREMEGVLHRYISLSSSSSYFSQSTLRESTTVMDNSKMEQSQYPLVALLVSESPFTKSTILRAQSSPVPFFLLHFPPVPTAPGMSDTTGDDDCQNWVGTAVWNPALGGSRGLLQGGMETRWERSLHGGGRPGLWWRNRKLKNWTPDEGSSETEDLDLTHDDLVLGNLARDVA